MGLSSILLSYGFSNQNKLRVFHPSKQVTGFSSIQTSYGFFIHPNKLWVFQSKQVMAFPIQTSYGFFIHPIKLWLFQSKQVMGFSSIQTSYGFSNPNKLWVFHPSKQLMAFPIQTSYGFFDPIPILIIITLSNPPISLILIHLFAYFLSISPFYFLSLTLFINPILFTYNI
jgi:hypothetical protein